MAGRYLSTWLFVVACPLAASAEERYGAWLADGTRLASAALPNWPTLDAPLRFANQDLMSTANPVRLLLDRQRKAVLKAPYIVLASGDVLPATPVSVEPELGRVRTTPRLVVTPEPPLLPLKGTTVSVRADRVQRIVLSAEAPAIALPAGTVVLSDGRRLVGRSIRFRENGLAILTTERIVTVAFSEVADVVLPAVNVLDAVLDDQQWAEGDAGLAIARFQATSGAILTTTRVSREPDQDRRRGRVISGVVYCVQPAWSDEPLALPEGDIVCCGYRRAAEMPLSSLPAATLVNRTLIGPPRPWTVNRTADGRMLAADQRQADVGLATHSENSIAFELPPEAQWLEASVGLDMMMADGGCVECRVSGEKAGEQRTLWESGFLQGKDGVKSTGRLELADFERLVLATEFGHEGRPAGADPLDIRDQVVWLTPLVGLDSSGRGTLKRAWAMLPGASEWTLEDSGWSQAKLASRWNTSASQWDTVLVLPRGAEVVFKRKVAVTRASDVVELLTVCPLDLDEHDFTLRVNGEAVPWRNNGDRNQIRQWTLRYSRARGREGEQETNLSDRLAYWWDLSPWRGQEVEIELTVRGKNERNEIAWRDLCVRSAIANLPASGEPLVPDVRLSSLEPAASEQRSGPVANLPENEPIRFLGQAFKDGVLLPRGRRVSFELKPEYERLVGVIGCVTQVAGPLQILIDDRVVWEREAISALAPAEQVDLPIPRGAKTITLQCGGESLYYGYAAMAEAGFLVGQASRTTR